MSAEWTAILATIATEHLLSVRHYACQKKPIQPDVFSEHLLYTAAGPRDRAEVELYKEFISQGEADNKQDKMY